MRQRSLNPMLSSVIVCPVVRLDVARHKDKSLSFFIAIALHAVVFVVGSMLFVHKPQFAVLEGENSIEIDLIAAPADTVNTPTIDVVSVKDEPALIEEDPVKEILKERAEPPRVIQETTGQDQQTLQSSGGAITTVQPDYLQNPAPQYPEYARRKKQQGLVLIKVAVDRFGKPTGVVIKTGSGYDALDRAAVKVVWKWKFKPAYAAALAVDSSVDVPIRFVLEDKK